MATARRCGSQSGGQPRARPALRGCARHAVLLAGAGAFLPPRRGALDSQGRDLPCHQSARESRHGELQCPYRARAGGRLSVVQTDAATLPAASRRRLLVASGAPWPVDGIAHAAGSRHPGRTSRLQQDLRLSRTQGGAGLRVSRRRPQGHEEATGDQARRVHIAARDHRQRGRVRCLARAWRPRSDAQAVPRRFRVGTPIPMSAAFRSRTSWAMPARTGSAAP